jgi:hypothetical protein
MADTEKAGVHADGFEEVVGQFQASLADAFDQGVLVGGEEADGVLQKQPFVDDKNLWRPAELFAFFLVGRCSLRGENGSTSR